MTPISPAPEQGLRRASTAALYRRFERRRRRRRGRDQPAGRRSTSARTRCQPNTPGRRSRLCRRRSRAAPPAPQLPARTMRNRSGIRDSRAARSWSARSPCWCSSSPSSSPTTPTTASPSSPPTTSRRDVPNADALVKGNEVRIGGARVGMVKSVVPVQLKQRPFRGRTLPQPRQERRTAPATRP